MHLNPTIKDITFLANKNKYPIYYYGDYYSPNGWPVFNSNIKMLNIWGIRSMNKNTSDFNDLCIAFYQHPEGNWEFEKFIITTDPSVYYLNRPINEKGTAILTEGVHTDLWIRGLHKGHANHKALIQSGVAKVYRDDNKDDVLDFTNNEIGHFGINMHRAQASGITDVIGKYSAGCQVHKDADRFNNVFMNMVDQSFWKGQTSYTYVLINEEELLCLK